MEKTKNWRYDFMISDPRNGWCDFQVGDFHGTPSYLTDVPVNLLDLFLDYRKKQTAIAWFDEEGTDFALILDPYDVFIIKNDNSSTLYRFDDIRILDLEAELIQDIERDITGWTFFNLEDDPEEIKIHRDTILKKLEKLKSYREK
jgi:hypothetical protein